LLCFQNVSVVAKIHDLISQYVPDWTVGDQM